MIIKGVPLASKKRSLRVRPDLDFSPITAQGKPTFVTIGAISGYSLPIYNNDNEELFFRFSIPRRWDGASDLTMFVLTALASSEDSGNYMALRASWARAKSGSVLSSGVVDSTVSMTVMPGMGTQYTCYEFELPIDYDAVSPQLAANNLLHIRLRRVSAGSPPLNGELIVVGVDIQLTIDKAYGA